MSVSKPKTLLKWELEIVETQQEEDPQYKSSRLKMQCYSGKYIIMCYTDQGMTDYLSLWPKPDFFNLQLRPWPPNFISENFHLSRIFR